MTSLDEAAQPMTLLKKKRLESGLSVAKVAELARVDRGTVWRIEEALIVDPKPASLLAIGDVLRIPHMDLFAAVGWLPSHELPSIGPYLQVKYAELPVAALYEIENHLAAVVRAHHGDVQPDRGPRRPASSEEL